MPPSKKFTFANQLRGIAVLSVVVAHYLGVYWFARSTVSSYIRAPIQDGPPPRIAAHILFSNFNYGSFGVAIFFLISGFVIPFSIEKLGRRKFLAARAFRIFPTYWIATSVTACMVYLSSKYWGQSYLFEFKQIIANLLLIHQETNTPSFDLVNWTLAIEVLFYICAALIWPSIKRSPVATLIGFPLAVLAIIYAWPQSWNAPITFRGGTTLTLWIVKVELMMISFIFIGTLFTLKLQHKIGGISLTAAAIAIFVTFTLMWTKIIPLNQVGPTAGNYGLALIVFSTCFVLREKFKPSKLLDFFADISYPLYLLHAINGYIIIRFLMGHHVRYFIAATVAFLASISIAYLVHITVEMPTASLWRERRSDKRGIAPKTSNQ